MRYRNGCIHYLSHIAIAYSMGQIIKSVCVCVSVCVSVRLRALSRSHIVIGKSFYIRLPNLVVIDRRRSYDVILIFQDGGHRVVNLLPVSVLVIVLVREDGNLLAYQISMRYLNPRLR